MQELERSDVFLSTSGCFTLSESFCKSFQKMSGNPYRHISYDRTQFPGLYPVLEDYISARDLVASSSKFWDWGQPPPTLDKALHCVLESVGSD